MDAQPGAIGAGQLDLERARGRRPGGDRGHCHKIQGAGAWERRVWGRHLFFQVCEAQPSLFGDARGWQDRGQRHGLIPERLGKARAGVRTRLAPGLKLPG
jgi:hypothetical protein